MALGVPILKHFRLLKELIYCIYQTISPTPTQPTKSRSVLKDWDYLEKGEKKNT